MSNNKSDGLLSGLLIGTAIGAVAGILAAPRAGKETRRVLKKSADALPELAEDLATSVQFQADRLSATALGNWEGTLERLREAIAAGQIASQQEWNRQASAANAPATNISATDISDSHSSESDRSPTPAKVAINRVANTDPAAAKPSSFQTHASNGVEPQNQ